MTNDPSRPNNAASGPGTARRRSITAGAVALAIVSFAAGGVLFAPHLEANAKSPLFQTVAAATSTPAPLRAAQTGDAAPDLFKQGAPFSFADLVEHVSPAVVTVQVDREEKVQNQLDNVPEQFRQFFGQNGQGQGRPQVQRGRALGSGFIIDAAGYIVTNNHVIDSETKVTVKLPDGREFEAKVVGKDEKTDVALLKIDGAKNLPTVAFGDDHHLRVGDWVVAVGNPFGLGGTVTAGIVSAIGRDIGSGPYTDFIQIDAPINQGNSGGPTFDLSGRVVGMNSAIYSPSGGSVGIGFAIPASEVQATVQQLRDHGAVNRGWLGVSIQDVTPEIASSVGAPDAKGAIVGEVIDKSPAAKAGFQQGDVILSLNGNVVNNANDLTRQVGGIPVGQQASFAVLRDGGRRTITATIEKRDDEKLASASQTPSGGGANGDANTGAVKSFGMRFMPITPAAREQFNVDDDVKGVIVTAVDPNSEADDKGFKPGDVIVSAGNKPVRAPADVTRAIADAKSAGRTTVLFLVSGEQGQHYVALRLDKA